MKNFFKFYALPILAGLSLIATAILAPVLAATAPTVAGAVLVSVATVLGGLSFSSNCIIVQHAINKSHRIKTKGYTKEELAHEQLELDEQARAIAAAREAKLARQIAKQEKKAQKMGQTKKASSDIENSNEETNTL